MTDLHATPSTATGESCLHNAEWHFVTCPARGTKELADCRCQLPLTIAEIEGQAAAAERARIRDKVEGLPNNWGAVNRAAVLRAIDGEGER